MMNRQILILAIVIVLMGQIATATYYYEPMNFESPKNHTFSINYTGFINVTIPNGFTLISGSLSGMNSLNFVIESPNTSLEDVYVGEIYVNGSFVDNYYFISIPDNKIVDAKVELGHGDFNYVDYNSVIGEDELLLFDIFRIWGIGTDIWNEEARDVTFTCTFPDYLPRTSDSKYNITYNPDNITAVGYMPRLEGVSMFRIFVLSQQVDMDVGDNYEVVCSQLEYYVGNTKIVADIPPINLSVRSITPLIISMANNTGYVTYSIMNNETYDLKDLEFIWKIGTDTIRQELGSLEAGDIISYDIPTNLSGEINFSARFVPYWMFNSRSPVIYSQSSFDTYYTPDYLSSLNSSLYFGNQSILTPIILEGLPQDYYIEVYQDPPFGDTYTIEYKFFNLNGQLQETIVQEVTGVGDHKVEFLNLDLEPKGLEEDFYVYTTVYIDDGSGGRWAFPTENIGTITIGALTDNGPRAAGPYDVVVVNAYETYSTTDSITADIVITNTGDTPDKDAILTYYLVDENGNRYGETREQILEAPIGTTIYTRTISLPLNAKVGEWKFVADYDTVVQPEIQVYDSFNVVTGFTIFDRFGRTYDKIKKSDVLWFIGLMLFILLILLFVGLRRRKRRDYDEFYERQAQRGVSSS